MIIMMNKLEKQRAYRRRTNNIVTKRYEKTPNGFLMRLYCNMQSRVNGVQYLKAHLYAGKSLIDRETFYDWAKNSQDFWTLYQAWTDSNYTRKLTPSVDRIDASRGYELDNMEWVTHSENSRRGGLHKRNVTI